MQQASRIKTWQPWAQSTGPRTAEGKATARMTAYKGGYRQQLRELSRQVNAEIREARDLVDAFRQLVTLFGP